MPGKLGFTSKQRKSVLRNQASDLLWNGKIETTQARAKQLKSYVDKILTLAINTYEDIIETEKKVTVVDDEKKGTTKEVTKKVIKDGSKKLCARRKIMGMIFDIQEKKGKESKSAYKARTKDVHHPLVEKIFNELAPKYAERAERLGNKGGYSRIYLLGERKGDAALKAIIALVD